MNLKGIFDKMDFTKFKILFSERHYWGNEKTAIDWDKIFTIDLMTKVVCPECIEDSYILMKQSNQNAMDFFFNFQERRYMYVQ